MFVSGNPMRHVAVMSFTTSVGLMAIFFVDLIDMVFISMLGDEALAAAVGFAGTILFFTTSISIGISIAAGALASRALGAGNSERARHQATSVLVLGVAAAILTMIAVFALMGPILDFLGATGRTRDLAVDYLTIILPSMPILMAAMVAGAVLRAHGDARRAMMSTLAGGAVNAVLDPILIFGAGLELQGAAIASVLARVTIFFVAFVPALRVYRGFSRPKLHTLAVDARPVFAIAGPAMLTNIATPIGTAIVTREIARFGPDAVAGMAMIARLTPVAFSVVFALSGAIGPIIGQNAGAERPDRVRETFLAGLRFVAAYVACVMVILFFLRAPLADLFGAEGVARDLVYLFCIGLALGFAFNGAIFVCNAAFNNLGHPLYSTSINWGRHTLGTWPLAIAGAALYGAQGVLIGQALGGALFAAIAIVLALRIITGTKGKSSPELAFPAREHVVESRRL